MLKIECCEGLEVCQVWHWEWKVQETLSNLMRVRV